MYPKNCTHKDNTVKIYVYNSFPEASAHDQGLETFGSCASTRPAAPLPPSCMPTARPQPSPMVRTQVLFLFLFFCPLFYFFLRSEPQPRARALGPPFVFLPIAEQNSPPRSPNDNTRRRLPLCFLFLYFFSRMAGSLSGRRREMRHHWKATSMAGGASGRGGAAAAAVRVVYGDVICVDNQNWQPDHGTRKLRM